MFQLLSSNYFFPIMQSGKMPVLTNKSVQKYKVKLKKKKMRSYHKSTAKVSQRYPTHFGELYINGLSEFSMENCQFITIHNQWSLKRQAALNNVSGKP